MELCSLCYQHFKLSCSSQEMFLPFSISCFSWELLLMRWKSRNSIHVQSRMCHFSEKLSTVDAYALEGCHCYITKPENHQSEKFSFKSNPGHGLLVLLICPISCRSRRIKFFRRFVMRQEQENMFSWPRENSQYEIDHSSGFAWLSSERNSI